MSDIRFEKIQSLDDFEKLDLYMHYFVTQTALRKSFECVYKPNKKQNNGWGKPKKETDNIEFHYLWEHLKIKTMEEFYDVNNIKITDFGDEWKEKGCAQRINTNYYGAYDWYFKFEKHFNERRRL